KTPVKALIDTSSKFNTISKKLFDKLKSNHEICPTCSLVKNLYGDAIGEINCLDLQFQYKETYYSLDSTDAINFEICKNPPFDLRHHDDILPVSPIHRRVSKIKKYPKVDLGKILWVKSDSSDTSDSSDSSSSRLRPEVIDMYRISAKHLASQTSVKKHPTKRKICKVTKSLTQVGAYVFG
ncbi:2858_t:CDS:2, partial [Diversispora eburnea]